MVVRGKASFAKIIGTPVLNKFTDTKQWSIDLAIDQDTVKEFKKLGLAERVKSKEGYLGGKPFLTFKQEEFRKDGTPNDPIPVTDINGAPWDNSKLIGNDSDVDVKFVVVDNGPTKRAGVYIRGVRVLKLIPYTRQEFEPLDEDDEFYQEAVEAAKKGPKTILEELDENSLPEDEMPV